MVFWDTVLRLGYTTLGIGITHWIDGYHMSRYHWIKTIVEDDNGELVIDLKEACEELGWKEGDVIEWIDNNDGTWTIKKKEADA